jgi:hypothetical protein
MTMLPTTSLPTTSAPTLPEAALRMSGAARLVLVINLGSFVAEPDADAFRHMRGSEAFAAALRKLRPSAPFGIDEATSAVEHDAYVLRIFRSRLLYNHFFPTYRIAWDTTMRERMLQLGCTDIAHWQRWIGRIRLTRNGLAVITLDQPFEDMSLIACTEQILELPEHGEQTAAHDQWTIAMSILDAFLDALGHQIRLYVGNGAGTIIRFTHTTQVKHSLRLDRFVVYAIKKIERDGRLLLPDELKRDYSQTLASFMEGTLVEFDGQRRFPQYAEEHARALVAGDVSSWDEELCLFSGESALIYFPLVGRGLAYVGGPLGLDARAYSAYWAGIVRGIEHLVAFRAEAQQTERRTTGLLSQIPGLTRKVNDGALSSQDLALIEHLAMGLSDIFDSLPELRSMAVTTNAFRADIVRRKFDVLLRELAVQETLDLVNTNVEQLNFFLSYYNDMRLQWQGQRTNSLGIGLGAVVLFMAISSFLADTFDVVDRFYNTSESNLGSRTFGTEVIVGVIGLLILGLMIWRSRKLFTRRARKTEQFSARLAAISGQAEERGS